MCFFLPYFIGYNHYGFWCVFYFISLVITTMASDVFFNLISLVITTMASDVFFTLFHWL